MSDSYSIYLKVDSTQVDTATKRLSSMADEANTVDVALRKMSSGAEFAANRLARQNQLAASQAKYAQEMTTALQNTETAAKKTGLAFDGLSNSTKAVRSAFTLFIGVEITRFLRDAASYAVKAGDAYTDMASKLTISTQSSASFNKALSDSSNIARTYYGDITAVAGAYAKLQPIVDALGYSQETTNKVVQSLSASLLVSGANTVDAAESFRQFAQAVSGPTIQMEEMNTIIDSNQALWRGLTRQFASVITEYGSLKKAISMNAITSTMLLDATVNLGTEFEILASKKVPTVANAMTLVKNAFIEYLGQANKTNHASEDIASTLIELSQNLDKILDPTMKAAEGFGELATAAIQMIKTLATIAEGPFNVLVTAIQAIGETATRSKESVVALQAVLGDMDSYKKVFEINEAKGGDKALESINEQIAKTKELKAQTKESYAGNPALQAEKLAGYDRELAKLNELKEGRFALADAERKVREEEAAAAERNKKAPSPVVDAKAVKKEADEAQKIFRAMIDANISAAQDQALLEEAKLKTTQKRMQLELEQAKNAADVSMEAAASEEEKIKIQEELAAKVEALLVRENELRQQQITQDEQILLARIAGVQQEIDAADRYNLTQSERIRLQAELQTLLAQQAVIPETRAQAEVEAMRDLQSAYEDLNKLRAEAANGEANVRDEALRTLEVLSSNLQYAKEMAQGMTDAFGDIGEAIGGLSVALAEYAKQQETIRIQKEEALKNEKDPAKRIEIEKDAAEKSAKSQIKAYGDMAASAQKFFKQGTAGYNAMGAAVKVFRAFEMAQSVMSAMKQIDQMGNIVAEFLGMETAKTAAKVASNTTQQASDSTGAVTSATKAVADAGQGDPYTGIVRAAAMLAFMAAIGIGVGGGGASAASAPPKLAGTGTVLGDPEAQSESLSHALDMLVEINSNDLAYSADMLTALLNIESALADASALIAKQVMPLVAGVMSRFNKTGGMSTSQVTEAGFIINQKNLQKVLASGTLGGLIGFRAETETSGFKSATQQVTAYGKKIAEVFGSIVEDIYKTVELTGKAVGLSTEEIAKRAEGFIVDIGKINIAGMSSEEVTKTLSAAFSAMSDTMAMKILPEFKDFQRSGEGYFETIARVGSGVKEATGRLELLGFQAVAYSEIENKRGDVAAEIAKKTLQQQTALGEGAKAYISTLTGSIEEVLEAYQQMVEVNDLMKATGINADNLSRAMANAAGGLSKLQEALETYHSEFFTDSEKFTAELKRVNGAFEHLGFTMPKTREEFRKMVTALNASPEEQARLLSLVGDFSNLLDMFDDLEKSVVDLSDSVASFNKDIATQIASLTSVSATAALSATRLQDSYRALFDSIGYINYQPTGSEDEMKLLTSLKGAIMDRYNSEMARLREVAQAEAEAMRAALQVQIDAINAATQAQVDAINSGLESQIAGINAATEAEVAAINDRLELEIEARQEAHEAQLEALQGELEAANKLKSAIQQVKDYARGMALGPNAPLSPEARLAEAQRQYQDLLRRAQGGDADAISQLSGASQTYLDAARQYFGSGTQYSNIFDGVRQAMEQIGGMSAPDPDSIQSHIDDLRKSQADEMKQLREAAQAQTKAVQEAAKDQIKSLQDAAKDQIKSIQDAAKDQIKALQNDVNQSIKDLTDIEKNPAMKKLRDDTIVELQSLVEFSEKIEKAAQDQAAADKDRWELQWQLQQDQTAFMGKIAEVIAPDSGTSKQEQTMNDMLTEQRALVTAQTAANPEIISQLKSVDSRLQNLERTIRLS